MLVHSSLRVVTLLSAVRAPPPCMMLEDAAPSPPQPLPVPEAVATLLVGCAVQAQLSYHNEFKNEVQGRWLEAFLGHEHLKVERVDSRGGGRLLFRGLSDVLRCEWREYFRTMLRGKPEKYACRYKVGTADTVGGPSASASDAARAGANTAPGDQPSWAAASASRAANPYLKKQETFREYTEVVEPRRIATGLMSIVRQLCAEWSTDLDFVAREGGFLLEACAVGADGAFGEGCDVDIDAAAATMMDGVDVDKALANSALSLPEPLYASLRAASAKWHSDVEEAPSPFRAENFDLLQRACTREAALSVLARLDAAADRDPRSVEAASAEWLRSKLADEWLPRFESPSRPQLAGLFCLSILSAPPTPRRVGDSDSGGGDGDGGTLRLVDPEAIGQEVLEARVGIASAWAAALATSSVSDALQELLREDLEGQLASNTDPEATRDDSD